MRGPSLLFPDSLSLADSRRGRAVFRRRPDRRETYQWVVPLGLLGALLPLALPGLEASLPGNRVLVVLLLTVLGLSFVRRCPVWVLDAALLAGGWGVVWSQLWLVLLASVGPGDLPAPALLSSLPWVPVLLLAHAWLLGERRGRVLSAVGLVGTLALTCAFAAGPMRAAGAEGSALLNLLTQVMVAGTVALMGQRAAMCRARADLRRGHWESTPPEDRDALTGLPGAGAITGVLAAHLPRRPQGLTVALFAVDDLERVRSERGEVFAECLSAHVARTLTAALRDEDVIGVLRGGTFVVLLRVPDARAARSACERLRVRVASRPLSGVLPTVSVGVSVWAGHEGGPALLADAERALCRARGDGRNRVQLAAGLEWTAPGVALSSR